MRGNHRRQQQSTLRIEPVRCGDRSDGGYGVSPDVLRDGDDRQLAFIERPLDTFHHQTFIVTANGTKRVAIPDKASLVGMVDGRVIVQLDEAWSAGGVSLPSGSVAELDLTALKVAPGALKPKLIWAPGPRDSLDGVRTTKGRLLISTLENVRGRAWVYTPRAGGGWTSTRLALPDNLDVGYGATDDNSDLAFVSIAGFLTPSTLYLADTAAGTLAPVKTLSPKFDAANLVVEQLEAASSDGTKIPYFVVHRKDIAYDGTTPTLMTAYGGFQVSQTPGYAPTVQTRWGVFTYLYAPKPETFQFLDDVFGEVLALFPGEFVHIGGDEAKKDQWNTSPTAQAFIKANGLKDAHELQSYFVRHAEKYLSAHGRRLVGWDEIQEGGLAAGATMMAWRDVKWAIAAAREGHDVVMTPTSHTYLDYNEGTTDEEGEKIGRGPLKLEKVYAFEPVPAELEPQFQAHVLGAQGQLWSEHLQSWPKAEFRAWPRLSALAEVMWSPREKRDYADFKVRLPALLARFDRLGVNYRRPRATDDAPPPAPKSASPAPAPAPAK